MRKMQKYRQPNYVERKRRNDSVSPIAYASNICCFVHSSLTFDSVESLNACQSKTFYVQHCELNAYFCRGKFGQIGY